MDLNKILRLIIFAFVCYTTNSIKAQNFTKYWIKFKDKDNSSYSVNSPRAFLSDRAIERRTKQGISVDMTDIPVNQTYVDQINATGASVFQVSKWMNAAIVIVSNSLQLTAINSLSCVAGSSPVAKLKRIAIGTNLDSKENAVKKMSNTISAYNYGPSYTQVNQVGADCLHEMGYRGQGILIAVIDAGFDRVNTNPVFDSLRNENRLLGTRDIVVGNSSVYEDNSHGANCLSLMAGNAPGKLIGTAPKASYWLMRSEDVASEKLIEECNWIVAAELADSLGADITTTSLGYTTFDIVSQNHTYNDLNGKTAVASLAATMAARKGMFVLNAAGNEGGGAWNYISVPADADSICTVGSVNGSGIHSGFSSVGPTADGRIKPELSAMGEGAYVCSPSYNFGSGNGTSYATPILAGAVACLWQANPTKTNMQILQALKATASKSANPDNDYGWGIPNMCSAHQLLQSQINSVDENKLSNEVQFFPNPVDKQLQFKLSQKVQRVEIIDVLGKQIDFQISEPKPLHYEISFESFVVPGIYFMTIKTERGIFNQRFIKE